MNLNVCVCVCVRARASVIVLGVKNVSKEYERPNASVGMGWCVRTRVRVCGCEWWRERFASASVGMGWYVRTPACVCLYEVERAFRKSVVWV